MPQVSQEEKALKFQELHRRPGAFVIPNPWDIGSVRACEAYGFEALATTSRGFGITIGKVDGQGLISRDETLAHIRSLVEATDLPVSADLENCFGDAPEEVAKTIKLAGEAGLVGGSIEDATGRSDQKIYDFSLALERVAAGVEAARALPFHFTVTARSENILQGVGDLDETLKRLQAFEEAGADVLYAPMLSTLDQIRTVCQAVSLPVNVLIAPSSTTDFTVEQLAEAGVKRISLGSTLAKHSFSALMHSLEEMMDRRSFTFAKDVAALEDLERIPNRHNN